MDKSFPGRVLRDFHYKDRTVCLNWTVRIWPFCDLFGIFPNNIIFAEDEKRTVDCEAALFDRNGVVNSHGPRSLGHRLLVYPLAPRGPRLPAGPSAGSRGTAATIAAGQFLFKACHSGTVRNLLYTPKLTPVTK